MSVVEKKMYRVEKFLPPECPKCCHKFKNESTDWIRLLGDIVDGNKVIRETNGYYIIICSKCDNYTSCIPLESYQLSSKEKAERLCEEEGFVNLITVTAFGNHCQDIHAKYNDMNDIKVRGIKCDSNERLIEIEKDLNDIEFYSPTIPLSYDKYHHIIRELIKYLKK